jgi:head-tail adaptor
VPGTSYVLWAENVRCAIDDWKPYEVMQAQQLGNQLSTRIRIRYRPGITTAMRLVYQTNPGQTPPVFEYYEIVGNVRDIQLRNECQLTCTLRTAAGFRTGDATNTAALGAPPAGP